MEFRYVKSFDDLKLIAERGVPEWEQMTPDQAAVYMHEIAVWTARAGIQQLGMTVQRIDRETINRIVVEAARAVKQQLEKRSPGSLRG